MHRRPWPLVLLAALLLVSPVLYPVFVAIFFGTPLREVLAEQFRMNSGFRNFEVFALPVLMAIGTYFARRPGYFVVLLGSLHLMSRGLYIFATENDGSPLSSALLMVFFLGVVVAYFTRRKTRALYFDSKMRWWETDPRYRVDLSGKVLRGSGAPMPVIVRNFAIGGALLEGDFDAFAPGEIVHVDFDFDAQPVHLAASVVWERAQDSRRSFGVQWMEDPSGTDYERVREIVRELKSRRVPTTGGLSWWQELQGWLGRPPETD